MYRLMIVDDNKLIRQNIIGLIRWEDHGFASPCEAFDGADALDKIRRNPPDIVLTDVLMPIMNGIELIASARTEYPQVLFAMLSNYDDFSYVKGALKTGAYDYILKFEMTADALRVLLENMKAELAARNRMRQDEKHAERHRYAAYLKGLAEKRKASSHDDHPPEVPNGILLSATGTGSAEILAELVEDLQKPIGWIPFECGGRHFLFLRYTCHGLNPDALMELMREVHWGKRRRDNDKHILAISNPIRGEDSFAVSYHNCCAMLDCAFYDCNSHVISERNFKPFRHEESLEEYLEFVARVIRRLQTNRSDEASRELCRLLTHMRNQRLELPQARMVLEHLTHEINELCFGFEAQLPAEFSKGMIPSSHFSNFWDMDEVSAEFSRIISRIDLAPGIDYTGVSNDIAAEVIRYIRGNYNRPISLQDAADHVMVNKNHLCRLLKQHARASFSTMLNTVRIRHAQRLLTSSTLSLQDVALAVGFSDYRYFKKVFTDAVGVVPVEFRHMEAGRPS